MTHITAPQAICRFGIARGDITPPVGIYCRMWGAARHDRATGVHRPLLATAIALAPDAAQAAVDAPQILVALDHCMLGAAEMTTLVEHVTQSAGIAKERLVVVFSHTHSAGLMNLDRVELPGGDLIPKYLSHLASKTAALVREALRSLQPATITYGYGRCSLAAHRDFWNEERREFVCGFNPQEPADDTLLVARATNGDGRWLASIVNYACHPTTLAWQNPLISPDYPGAMRETVEQVTSAPCVFLQGASGELGPRDGFVGEVEVADRNGRQLGFAALSALTALPPPQTKFEYTGPVVSGATLGTWAHVPLAPLESARLQAAFGCQRFTVELPYRTDLATHNQTQIERAAWQAKEQAARDAGRQQEASDCRAMVERCTRRLARLAGLPTADAFPMDVALWRIGDGLWVAVEGEPYNFLQRELRMRFPNAPIVICVLSGGSRPSYLPTRETYGRGIYQESIAMLAPGSLEQLVDKIGQRIERWFSNATVQ
jgi:hypothetical protein